MTDAINNTDHGQDTNRISIEAPMKEASMTDMITTNTNHKTEQKLTAAQVEKECPEALQTLGKRIAAHFDKARKCEAKAEQHYTAIAQLLAKAEEACDGGGFTAFRERFFPNLGKSRVYELLQIATNEKSVEEVRTDTRERVARHRANKATASVTVTENAACPRGPRVETRPRGVAAAHRDTRRVECIVQIKRAVKEIMEIVSDPCFDDQDRRMVRHEHEPYLDGFIDERGTRRFEPSRFATIEPTLDTVGPQGNGDSPDKPAKDQRPHPKHDLAA